MNNLRNRRALITGSSSGIGLGIAAAFAKQGANILLHGIEPQAKLDAIALDLSKAHNTEVIAFSADLSSAEAIETLVQRIEKRAENSVDVLVNNAGIQHVAPIEDFPLAMWQKLLDIHLTAPFLLSQKLLPRMRKNGWGRVINIASVHGLVASAQKSAYVSAKHGLVGFTKTLALETAGSGVTCNAICPGWVRTPLVEAQIEARAKRENVSIEEASKGLIGEKQPSQKFVTVDQIGELAAFLASDNAQGMTGSIMTIDGGWTAQ